MIKHGRLTYLLYPQMWLPRPLTVACRIRASEIDWAAKIPGALVEPAGDADSSCRVWATTSAMGGHQQRAAVWEWWPPPAAGGGPGGRRAAIRTAGGWVAHGRRPPAGCTAGVGNPRMDGVSEHGGGRWWNFPACGGGLGADRDLWGTGERGLPVSLRWEHNQMRDCR